MEFTTQHYPCSLCKNENGKTLFVKQDFPIVQCAQCGFVYVDPRINDESLAKLYQHNYFQNKDYGYLNYDQEKRLRIQNFSKWIEDAKPFIPAEKKVTALDVGCAAGYCLTVMKEKGWEAEGLELDEELCAALQKNGLPVFNTSLEIFQPSKLYDVITLFDVIEHIPGVDKAFQKLGELLTEDGIVVMVTPDHNSLQRKIAGKKWFQYKPIEHIQYFTLDTLTRFAERNGLEIVQHKRSGQYADVDFINNRLKYYRFTFLSTVFSKLTGLLRLKHKMFYTDTGSLFVVLKKIR